MHKWFRDETEMSPEASRKPTSIRLAVDLEANALYEYCRSGRRPHRPVPEVLEQLDVANLGEHVIQVGVVSRSGYSVFGIEESHCMSPRPTLGRFCDNSSRWRGLTARKECRPIQQAIAGHVVERKIRSIS